MMRAQETTANNVSRSDWVDLIVVVISFSFNQYGLVGGVKFDVHRATLEMRNSSIRKPDTC